MTPPYEEVVAEPSTLEGEGVPEGPMVIPPPPSIDVLADWSSFASGLWTIVAPSTMASSPGAPLKPHWEGLTEDQLLGGGRGGSHLLPGRRKGRWIPRELGLAFCHAEEAMARVEKAQHEATLAEDMAAENIVEGK
ncbi:hypothetical protein GW17_00044646 [Ensete ventricosum]|nr:hypothetical protein GW17_00044646 [Ensete ventricosum]